jgi:hypothetical protein
MFDRKDINNDDGANTNDEFNGGKVSVGVRGIGRDEFTAL